MRNASRLLLLVLWFAFAAPSVAAPSDAPARDDRFLAGVATAVLQLRFGLRDLDVVVKDGRLWLDPEQLGDHDPQAVKAALDGVQGLRVTLAPAPDLLVPSDDVLPRPAGWTDDRPATTTTGFLPEQELFAMPIADPRAPASSGAVLWSLDDDGPSMVGRADFGDSLPLYGWRMAAGTWQAGIQGGVFSIFDIDRPSPELVNSDFLLGLPLEARYGDLSARMRIFHQSSHLGDEFLLRTDTERINLSYEAIELLLAYQLDPAWRIYGGGSSLIRKNPDDLDPFGLQAGLEYQSPEPMFSAISYPLAAVDVQSFEETDWRANVSLRAGVELKNGFVAGSRVQLLAEYFNGRSPNGQFFERTIEYAGLGVRVLF